VNDVAQMLQMSLVLVYFGGCCSVAICIFTHCSSWSFLNSIMGVSPSLTYDDLMEAELNLEEIRDEVEKRMQSKGEVASKRLDMLMTSALNRITSDINNTIFPKGLMKPFPANCLSLMTITGAKGGLVLLSASLRTSFSVCHNCQ
jgi:hypothetical protein